MLEPQVVVYFDSKLFRGNRTSKLNNASLNAFGSPNMRPLATFGINIDGAFYSNPCIKLFSIAVEWDAIFHDRTSQLPFAVHAHLDNNVGVLRIFPSITVDTVGVRVP